jgi:hypothetical protein
MVTLNYGHGATRPEQAVENRQRLNGPRQVLQDETYENVVEGFRGEWQGEDVRLLELHIGDPRRIRRPLGLCERVSGNINRRESCVRTPLSQGDRLGSNATPRFEDHASSRV